MINVIGLGLIDGMDVRSLLKPQHVVFDVKCTLDRGIVDGRL